jgi:hypothetical protein
MSETQGSFVVRSFGGNGHKASRGASINIELDTDRIAVFIKAEPYENIAIALFALSETMTVV